MICGGDEISRTQRGNNNAYCQDNELSWYDWDVDERKRALLEFTSQLIEFRKAHPNLHRRKFFQDREVRHSAHQDIAWYRPDGQEMTDEEWNTEWMRSLGVMFNGRTLNSMNEMGQPLSDDTFLILLNAHHETVQYSLPSTASRSGWTVLMNTAELDEPFRAMDCADELQVEARCVVLLCERPSSRL